MKVLLIYSPFCTPVVPPYSIANLYSFLKTNNVDVEVLDLNQEFHRIRFPEYHKYYRNFSLDDYEEKTNSFMKETKQVYSDNNRIVKDGGKPELFDEILSMINDKNADIVAFSTVFSSQVFYTKALMDSLDCKLAIGGPAASNILKERGTYLSNEVELLEFINGIEEENSSKTDVRTEYECSELIDFSHFNNYFTPKKVVPIKTSSACYYRQCAFCTHHQNTCYFEFPLDYIEKTIKNSGAKHFFFIDDMIHKKRLLAIAEMLKPLNVKWTCQLKPSEFDKKTLQILYDSGLSMIIWGVESGNDRVLTAMRKGTNSKEVSQVLKDSSDVGIKNVVYIMFGFPTETKEEFIDTMNFLEENNDYISLISTSVFGLQKGTPVYDQPELFGVTKITEKKRTILEPKITYEVSKGLSNEEAVKLRSNYKKTIDKINKYPKSMNYFREHMFILEE